MPALVDSINCEKCGAPLPVALGVAILTCPYCGTVSRLSGGTPFVLRHGMLVARVDRGAAERAIGGWMAGGVMTPSDLRKSARLASIECVYVPFFVFEVDAATAYGGVLTRTGTNERRTGRLARNYFWKVLGRRSGEFPVREYKLPLAFKAPFETSGMVPGSRFLNAEVDEVEAERIAREEVDAHQRELLKDFVDAVEEAKTEVTVKDAEFLHAPLWFASYGYREQKYDVILDAASGEIVKAEIPPPTGGFGEFLRELRR